MLVSSSTVSAQPQTNSLLPVSVYSQFTAPLIYSTLVHPVSCLENNLRSSPGGRESYCHSQGKQTDTVSRQQTQQFESAGTYQRPLRGEGGKRSHVTSRADCSTSVLSNDWLTLSSCSICNTLILWFTYFNISNLVISYLGLTWKLGIKTVLWRGAVTRALTWWQQHLWVLTVNSHLIKYTQKLQLE